MAQRKKAAVKTKPKVAPVPAAAGSPAAAKDRGPELTRLIEEATRHHVAKRLVEAEAVYRRILAIERNPGIIHNLGAALRDQGRPADAMACFRDAIAIRPEYPDAHSNLGYCLIDLDDVEGAESAFNKALQLKPQLVEALCGRAVTYMRREDLDRAEKDYRAALAVNPKHVPTLNNYGHLLRNAYRFDEGVALYKDALVQLPDEPTLWSNLGGTLLDAHRLPEAIEPLKKSIELRPDLSASHGNLGTIYITLGRIDEAIESHRRAVASEPDDPKHYVNLGASLKEAGRLGDAAECYRKAISLRPKYDYAVNNLGNLYREQGVIREALECFRKAIEINPNYLVAYSNKLFTMNSLGEFTPQEVYAAHREFGVKMEKEAPATPAPSNDPSPERPLRIGYVSPDLLGHSVAYFIENLLEHHDRQNFHITCYALNKRMDSMSRRLQHRADQWRACSVLTDDQLTEQIRADQIDILIDLAGHTANNRLTVFARGVAPVQATYLGYPNTSGLSTIGYRLTDAWADPPGIADQVHSEKLVRLPRGFLCFRPSDFAPEVTPRPVAQNGYITFGSFNSLAKAVDPVVAAWSRILNQVPNSRLMLKSNSFNDPPTLELYQKRFAAHGITPDRLELTGRIPLIGDHLALYGKVDIALDPFPYNGTTTTCEALWMGVPVMTIEGDRHAGRVTYSLLKQIDVPELIASDVDDYVARAVALAKDPARLQSVSARLRPAMEASPLRDGPGFARDVEAALRSMWQSWCAEAQSKGAKPAAQPAAKPAAKAAAQAAKPVAPPAASAETPPDKIDPKVRELIDRGTTLFQQGDPVGAEKAFREAVTLDPKVPEGQLNLGTALKRLQRIPEAVACYQKAIELRPQWPSAHSNLGSAYCDLGRQDEAEAACRKAIEFDPRNRNAYSNLASVYSARRDDEKAIEYFEKAIEIGPAAADLYNNLAVAYIHVGRLADASRACGKAIELQPRFAEAHANLASVLSSQGKVREARDANREVVALKPDLQLAWSNLLFNLNYADDLTPQQIYDEHRIWGERQKSLARTSHDNQPDPGRRLRVGYVSSDFCGHSVAFFFKPIIDRHDKSQFEIFCYSDVLNSDIYTDLIKSKADHWRPITGLPDEDVVQMVLRDQIDILVDLAGHTRKNRLAVFARKPAPLQVSWLGYPNTTGLTTVDYRVVDEVTDPSSEPGPTSVEKLVRIPGGFLCYEAAAKTPDVGPLPAEKNGAVTFGSFNNITKLTPYTVRLWSRVLSAVPKSRLLMKSRSFADDETKTRYSAMFAAEGIGADRIEFLGWQPHLKSHLEIYHQVDIALDTFPYHGTTTTCEAGWMGIPVITRRGNRHAARVGATINTALGLTELIADSDDDFVARAVALAGNVAALAALRAGLRARMRASPLCDSKRFTGELEKFYRGAWQEWCGAHGGVAASASVPAPAADTSRPLRVLINGGVEVTMPYDLKLISPYVLLEQEDWFESEMPFVRGLLQPGDNVVDIGANYGVYSLSAATAVGPQGRVWSFEPASNTAAFLAESIRRNGFANIVLDQTALSDREGEARLGLPGQSELNALSDEGMNGETVKLRTLDSWFDQYGTPDIAFIKLDAEGEEPNVIRGGARTLATSSPLILFEIKSDKLNLHLVDQFAEIGYSSYRLVPGLGVLTPFVREAAVDGFLLNLFACKPDRAAKLAARGLLAAATPRPAVAPPAGLWRTAMASKPFAAQMTAHWFNRMNDGDPLSRALDAYFYAQDPALPADQRLAALELSHNLLEGLVTATPLFAHLSTFGRVCMDLGHHGRGVETFMRLLSLAEKRLADDSLPFLPPLARFDSLSPGGAYAEWFAAAILEGVEKGAAYSSFWSSAKSAARLEEICKTGFQSKESERRRQLIRLRSGAQKAPETTGRLSEPGPDNLNIGFWAPRRKSEGTPKTLLDLLPDLPIINVIDVGALMFPDEDHPYARLVDSGRARVIGFEPDPAECAKLNAIGGGRRYYPYFIGDGSEAVYYQTNNAATGSLYRPNRPLLEKFNKLPEFVVLRREHHGIRTHRLDDLMHLEGVEDIDFVKIDVQGAELDVFKGASKVLSATTVIQTEVEFVPLYENQPLFGDVDVHLRRQGYQFHTFLGLAQRCFLPFQYTNDPFRGIRQTLWADAIFVRDFVRLDLVRTDKLLKMAVILDSLYQSFDLVTVVLSEVDRRQGSQLASTYMQLTLQRPGAAG